MWGKQICVNVKYACQSWLINFTKAYALLSKEAVWNRRLWIIIQIAICEGIFERVLVSINQYEPFFIFKSTPLIWTRQWSQTDALDPPSISAPINLINVRLCRWLADADTIQQFWHILNNRYISHAYRPKPTIYAPNILYNFRLLRTDAQAKKRWSHEQCKYATINRR